MNLSKNWITEKLIDFEYKKYELLAYLQEVKQNYANTKVYPYLSDLINHYRELLAVKKTSSQLINGGKGEMKNFNWKEMKLVYDTTEEDHELIKEIKQIIEFSLPLFANKINAGKSIYDFVEDNLKIKAVGITPLRTNEGYLLLHCQKDLEVYIYQYQFSFFTVENENMRSLNTHFLSSKKTTITYTYQKIKHDLIQENSSLPNPAVYAIDCAVAVPLNETFLPIAKRFFVRKMVA